MHKPLRAGRDDIEPMKNARASVTEVIVIEGPALVIPIMNLFSAERP